MFVHMGGSWGKDQEVNIIKSGFIWYKKADIHDITTNIIDNTAKSPDDSLKVFTMY